MLSSRRIVFLRKALVRGLNRIPLTVNHRWVQVFLAFGGSLLIVAIAVWLRTAFWPDLPVWLGPAVAAALLVALFAEGAFEEWDSAATRADVLEAQVEPTFEIINDKSFRESSDRQIRSLVLEIHNRGLEPARQCYAKLDSIVPKFSVEPIPLVDSPGFRLKWNHTDQESCDIAGTSREYLSICYRLADSPNYWHVHLQGPNFPMPAGIYDVGIEVCGDNIPKQSVNLRISYTPRDGLDLEIV